jgi:DNA-binding XRE family transcriptional regulator
MAAVSRYLFIFTAPCANAQRCKESVRTFLCLATATVWIASLFILSHHEKIDNKALCVIIRAAFSNSEHMEETNLSADIVAPEGIPEKEFEPRQRAQKAPSPLEVLGMNLKARRIHRELTIDEFAKIIGVSVKTYRRIADGTGNPTYETLLRIAIATNTPITITPSSCK